MKIGNVEINNNVFLAPMAGITDMPFRMLCKNQGAGLTYTEMVSAKGFCYKSENTNKLLETFPEEKPVAVQLFGSEPDILANAAKNISFADIIDINMGCPAPKIVKSGEGCALMDNPDLVAKIISSLVKAVKKPVTIKIRKGFKEKTALKIAKIAEECGAKAITVHGRMRDDFYGGCVDLDIIKEIKQNVNIKVIGNGDIKTPQDAKYMLEYTGCDAVMIGRAACGNPFIFSQIIEFLKSGQLLKLPSLHQKIDMAMLHIELLIKHKYNGINEARKHVAWYIKCEKNSNKARELINKAATKQEMYDILMRLGD